MSERWAGITCSAKGVTIVVLDVSGNQRSVYYDDDMDLPQGNDDERPSTYRTFYDNLRGFLREHKIDVVAIKSSATVPRASLTKGALQTAEVRAISMLAAQSSGTRVEMVLMSAAGKNTGTRPSGDYIKDTAFWGQKLSGKLRNKESRESAFLIYAKTKGIDDQ